MGQKTPIEWTDDSTNLFHAFRIMPDGTEKRGWFCVLASKCCENCYAQKNNLWVGNGLHFVKKNEPLVRIKLADQELAWIRTVNNQLVFVNDMSDWFGSFVSDEQINTMLDAMEANKGRSYLQTFTKRAARQREFLTARWGMSPPSHIIGGISVGCNRDIKWIDDFRHTPFAVRQISIEPLIEDLDRLDLSGIHRIIIGGESGEGDERIRVCETEWVEKLIENARAYDCRVFVKQMGSIWAKRVGATKLNDKGVLVSDTKGSNMDFWPESIRIRELPAALDGWRSTQLQLFF